MPDYQLLQQAFSPENFRRQAHQLVDVLAEYLASVQKIEEKTVIPFREPEQNLRYWQEDFQKPLLEDPTELFQDIINRSTHLHHSHYMGHQVTPPLLLAALSGMLSDVLNNGMAVYEMGLVSNPLEKIVTDWLAKKLGFDNDTSGLLTSGGTLANLTALLAARAAKASTDVWEEGSTDNLAVMVSEEAHYCIDRAARIMGMGSKGIIKIPVNERYQMRTELLESYFQAAHQQGLHVIAVIGSACSTSTGAYDNLEEIATFCQQHQLWFHTDGAHGGAVVLSEKYKYLVKGIEKSDSVVVDFHKMLMMPALSTALIFRNETDAYHTFQQKAQYLWSNQQSMEWYNSGKRTFECTKLMMSLKIYVSLRTYGEALFRANIEVLHDLARRFAEIITARSQWELALQPESNIVCFRYCFPQQINVLNQQLRKRLLEDGSFYIVQTMLRGDTFLRVSLMNPLTSETDLLALLEKMEEMVKKMPEY